MKENFKKISKNINTKGFFIIKNFINSSDIDSKFLNHVKNKEKFVDGVIHGLDDKYYTNINTKIKKIAKNLNNKNLNISEQKFFYASIRIDIRRSTQIKNSDGRVIGNRTRVKIVKNKVAPPFRLAEFDIMYGKGISKVGEIIDLAVNAEIINKSGSWFSYEGTKLGQGRDAVKGILSDNPELMEKLEKQIKDLAN